MPSLGADMEAGRLVEWHVKPGDAVKRGDVVAVVESDKGAIDVEIWETGTVAEILVAPGTKVPVGTVLATIRADGEPIRGTPPATAAPSVTPTTAPPPPPTAPAAPPVPPTTAPPPPPPSPGPVLTVRASPAARQRARELGVDLSGLAATATGPSGAISVRDVERAATPSPPPAPLAPPTAPDMRRAIGSAMARSKREIPHYYLATEIDMHAAVKWLEAENRTRAVADRLLPLVLLVKAVARAAVEIPEMNGLWVDGAFRPSSAVHVGIAIALRGNAGLVAPALHDVQSRPVADLMPALADLIRRARSGHLRSSEMTDPTITVTSLGDQGVDAVYGVIFPPQVALVGFGAITERPCAVGGMLGVRPRITATLSADHRASDGHRGALFLTAMGRHLAAPEALA